MQKRRREIKADGSWICARCKLRGSKVETELHVAQKERDQAAEKARESSLLLKEEKNKRLKLEDKITQRLCRGGRYKLEGLDAAIVPDGVVAYELEEAQRQMREASEAASRMANKLAVERQEKRDIVRQTRKERADLVEERTVCKRLQAEFEKTAKRRTIQAEISERQTRAEQDIRLVENCSEYRELLVTEKEEKRKIIREDRKSSGQNKPDDLLHRPLSFDRELNSNQYIRRVNPAMNKGDPGNRLFPLLIVQQIRHRQINKPQ